MTQLYNQVSERDKRRILRNNMPRAEAMLWARLRNCQVCGFKFRRQYSVGAFVIDFYCAELKLAIEVDGASHRKDGIPEYDAERQLFLEAKGITVLRVMNEQVYEDLDTAIGLISRVIGEMQGVESSSPLYKGGLRGVNHIPVQKFSVLDDSRHLLGCTHNFEITDETKL